MAEQRDTSNDTADDDVDTYDVATWEVRTWLDGVSVSVYRWLLTAGRLTLIALATIVFIATIGFSAYAAVLRPTLGALTLLSVVPALALAAYIWYGDPTNREPPTLLALTFLLGVLFASFAAVINSLFQTVFQLIPVIGLFLFFYLVVAPVEESVKWLAIRVKAYNSPSFNAVIDGAVYGAVAGLGFATIENALYITREVIQVSQMTGMDPVRAGISTATSRAFAGPGHVIYSAFAGYYLGLAKFNQENFGPIAVKGLLIAAFLHGTYNSLVSVVHLGFGSFSSELQFAGFIILFDGIIFALLYRKLRRYRAYHTRVTG
ncbi:MAG: PrsW family intramembrane metalloprotease [Salinirussus sp.]